LRLGVLGGTFDPIHHGHLLLAEQAREALSLDRVLVIPAGRPPHKPQSPITPYPERLRMCQLAVPPGGDLEVSELERGQDQPSFTVETLRRLRAGTSAGDELWLLLGSDSLPELPTWREPREILKLSRLAVYPRPGEEESPGAAAESPAAPPDDLAALLAGCEVRYLDGPRIRLSSSEIRRRLRDGRTIRFLVPEAVRKYILAKGLYRGA
jgi:nicotinate-nucleotide adenylyltransferase